jgi:hypothetical protein
MNPKSQRNSRFADEVSPRAGEYAPCGKKTPSEPCGDSETAALRVGIGLQNRCTERKSRETTPTQHELQPKWEISAKATESSESAMSDRWPHALLGVLKTNSVWDIN